MLVNLDEHGWLEVTAENALEAYALKQWWKEDVNRINHGYMKLNTDFKGEDILV